MAIDGARLALVNPEAPRIDHGDLAGDWIAADLDGTRCRVQPSSRTAAKLGPFLVPATLGPPDGTVPAADVDLHLTLGSWRIVGAVQQCLEITRQHVVARMQFGKPLAEFQAVRFTVADAAVAARGLHELAKYTISRIESVPAQVRSADALILRDESDVSVLDRHTQPLIRLPVSTEVLATRLLPGIRDGGFETLFSGPVSA
jgi:hypothetical protein